MGKTMQHECGGWIGATRYAGENSMGYTDCELAAAARHVAEARRIVALHRAHMVKLKARGVATLDQDLTLRAFVSALAVLEGRAQELADTAKRFKRPPRKLS